MKVDVLIGFVVDLIKRFIKPTPQFFKILQFLSAAIFALFGLQGVIHELCTSMGICISLPEWWDSLYSKATGIASILSMLIAQLTVTTDAKKDLDVKD
jgi:succinate dehydrogenase hydrophobic anchor subunit